jgi:pimeloyl-ACP methyl ester carboxylesterase
MREFAAAVAASIALLVPSVASAAPPNPFGHPCADQSGVLFCPSATLDQRVPSWDGVPIDVDVTLPETGDGPYPTIVMVHGLGQSKTAFESTSDNSTYSNRFYAEHGYAVVNLSERGYGNSCGTTDSRTSPGCDRGWQHLDDQAYEARDIQYLLGLLVDEGVSQPSALGVTGVSYGGGMTNMLAYLKDRVRMPDGSLVPWMSPNGTPLHIAAAWSRWGWADLSYALLPNGRFLESKKWTLGASYQPLGILKQSFVSGLYFVTTQNFLAPTGLDPNADLTAAYKLVTAGEPYGSGAQLVASLQSSRKSAVGLFGSTPAPMLVQNGWTDDLFPATEALMIYGDTDQGRKGPVSLQLGDLGHGRGANKPNEDQFFDGQGLAFFDAYLKKQPNPIAPGSVTAFTQTCPTSAPAGGPIQAASWAKIHPGTFKLSGARAQRVSSSGGDPKAAKVFDEIVGGNPCPTTPANKGKGTARYSVKVKKGFTMVGLPLVKATIKTKGSYGELDARLYDVYRGTERLVTRSAYRLTNNQAGKIAFQLDGNAYKFGRGHTVQLELLGKDPNYLRTSNGKFSVTVSRLSLSLPTRERKPL